MADKERWEVGSIIGMIETYGVPVSGRTRSTRGYTPGWKGLRDQLLMEGIFGSARKGGQCRAH
jgi:hypothetical protein